MQIYKKRGNQLSCKCKSRNLFANTQITGPFDIVLVVCVSPIFYSIQLTGNLHLMLLYGSLHGY